MAEKKEEKKKEELYYFGTKREWIVCKNEDKNIVDKFGDKLDLIAKDEIGYYYTQSNLLGLTDSNRLYRRIVPTEETVNAIINPPKPEEAKVEDVKVLFQPVNYEQLGNENVPPIIEVVQASVGK